jgi:hypothetical protein
VLSLENKIKILRYLKSDKTDFKECTSPEPDECRQYSELPPCLSVFYFETKIGSRELISSFCKKEKKSVFCDSLHLK